MMDDLIQRLGSKWGCCMIVEEGVETHLAPNLLHDPEPGCWCEPMIDIADENVWVHQNLPFVTGEIIHSDPNLPEKLSVSQ